MAQETTKEFSARLRMAVEGHPLAPETAFGQQSWLREKLEREGGVTVSANAIHKWMNGTARPREDNIRKIAKVLSVDELWLSMGKTPGGASKAETTATPSNVQAAALAMAGLIEMAGGRVVFPGKDDPAHIRANIGDREIGMLVVRPDCHGDGTASVLVPEPVGDLRVIAVKSRIDAAHSVCIDIYDLTDVPRQKFGGYSVIQLEGRKGGKYKIEGVRNLIGKLESVEALAA